MVRILDHVQHPMSREDEMAWREPQSGPGDFRLGSRVTVRPSQVAIFVRDGRALDVFGPGTHEISTGNIPLLAGLIATVWSGNTPFTAELYFVNQQDFPQIGWGTPEPIPMETPGQGFGWLLLGARGIVDVGIADPKRFLERYAMNRPSFYISDLKDRLLTVVIGELTNTIADAEPGGITRLQGMINDIEMAMLAKLRSQFESLGLMLNTFEIQAITPRKTAAEDLRNMGLLTIEQYAALQQTDAYREAARNQGEAGAASGMGVGMGMGMAQMMAQQQQMMQQMMQNMQNQQNQQQGGQQQAAAPSNPQTVEEIEALIDNLDMRLANGEISEKIYERLVEKWEKKLDDLKG